MITLESPKGVSLHMNRIPSAQSELVDLHEEISAQPQP